MSLTKKLTFILLIILALAGMALLFFALSNAKPRQPDLAQQAGDNLSLGESTKEDVIQIKGKPDITTYLLTYELMKYETKVVDYQDFYAFNEGRIRFYLTHNYPVVPFKEFSNKRGNGLVYHDKDDAFLWHVYPTSGIAVSTIGDSIVKTLFFKPVENKFFLAEYGELLGLSLEEPSEDLYP